MAPAAPVTTTRRPASAGTAGTAGPTVTVSPHQLAETAVDGPGDGLDRHRTECRQAAAPISADLERTAGEVGPAPHRQRAAGRGLDAEQAQISEQRLGVA